MLNVDIYSIMNILYSKVITVASKAAETN